jgi:flagellar biogenesis protein FliO
LFYWVFWHGTEIAKQFSAMQAAQYLLPVRARFLVLLAVICAASLQAGEVALAAVPVISGPPQSIGGSFLRVTGSVVFVIGLFLSAIWLFKNWQRITVRGGQVQNLRVLEVKSLGPRNAVYVIGYQRERLLLSSTPAGVSLLAHLPEADACEPGGATVPVSFAQALVQTLSHKS